MTKEISIETFGTELNGADKYLGGELADNGALYGIPGSGRFVIKIDSDARTVENLESRPLIGPYVECSMKKNRFKWLRGIRDANGHIYGLPCNADRVLRVIPSEDAAVDPEIALIGDSFTGNWKWHGACLAADGAIYTVPCNSDGVLKIKGDTTELIKTDVLTEHCDVTPQKWYGGLLGVDGNIYGIPNCSNTVFKFNVETQLVELLEAEDGDLGVGGWKWHGGASSGDFIYGFPANETRVLKIEPLTGRVYRIGEEIVYNDEQWQHHRNAAKKSKYKFGGGITDPKSGNVYCFPSDSHMVMKITVATDEVTLIGEPLLPHMNNKWQNGFVSEVDGCIYAIPCNATHVLRIDPTTDEVSMVGPDFGEDLEKWEGGCVGADGALYCFPQMHKQVLRIAPVP